MYALGPATLRSSVLILAATALGCGWDYTPSDNILPDPNAEGSDDEGPPPPETGDTGGAEDLPATYRFDCVDIRQLGDADQDVFQVATLQNTWASDIAGFRLNILFDLIEEDSETGEATIAIRSGVGMGWTDQCSEPSTETSERAASIEPGVAEWAPSQNDASCAVTSTAGPAAATYDVQLGAEDLVYIYAEDNDGTAFNCKVGGGAPDAIPIAGIATRLTLSEDRSTLAGTLTGCMSAVKAQTVCSCLSVCSGAVHEDCQGCPGGAVPLGLLLGGIAATPYCSDLLGEEAFDIVLEFSASRLAEVPTSCG